MEEGTINVADAVRLKDNLNENITCGQKSLNARQIEKMRELNEHQAKQLKEALSSIRKTWWLLPDWIWIVGALAGILIILFVSRNTLPIVGAMLISGYCLLQLGFRAGHQEGFVRGFEDGNSSGVDKAFGISVERGQGLRGRC